MQTVIVVDLPDGAQVLVRVGGLDVSGAAIQTDHRPVPHATWQPAPSEVRVEGASSQRESLLDRRQERDELLDARDAELTRAAELEAGGF